MEYAAKKMNPKAIVAKLDEYIVGQNEAKKAVAIAIRNRIRRQLVEQPMRNEITPKNILMIGPTGVGKTEIARRLAKLVNAPFVKVEATKFTEVGYVGKDVDSIIRDLVEIAIKNDKERLRSTCFEQAKKLAIERIVDILLPPARMNTADTIIPNNTNTTREKFIQMIINKELDHKEIEIEVSVANGKVDVLLGPPGLEELTNQIQNMFKSNINNKKKKKQLTIAQALIVLTDEELDKLINDDEVYVNSLKNVEDNGIVFIDEIDKVINNNGGSNADVSRSGVQRDLLPLVEGTSINTKYGIVKTDHILFIASGAFHIAKPSDLLPELQGRFPIRVELHSLSINDFEKILTQTNASLTKQYELLLATDNIHLSFNADGITKMAEIAYNVNEKTENIGARRLHTIIEKLLEDISYSPEDYQNNPVLIDADFVIQKLEKISHSEDLSRYIL